jgi:hypothetical protein
MTSDFADVDKRELQVAKNLLENPGIAAKITNILGTPIEKGFELLPANWSQQIGKVAQAALTKASDAAIFTMKDAPGASASNIWHKLGVFVSGGVGGFFGIAGLTAELPISTTLMLRSIADIARSQGESVLSNDTKLACLEVFALGGDSESDDATESGYYAVRTSLARSVSQAAEFLAEKSAADASAPAIIRFIVKVADRFSIQITEKAAAQAAPAIGAVGGAVINTIFIDHFQDMARGHFVVRKLERKYGSEAVKQLYDALPKNG